MSVVSAEHDAGGKSRLAMIHGVEGKAEFYGERNEYRLWLSRNWSWRRFTDGRYPYALWIGMNPSVAAADIDDPTIRREMQFTEAMGIECYVKCNVMDYRSTDPKRLLAVEAPCSDKNRECIAGMARNACIVIAAWGALPKPLRKYADAVITVLSETPLYCMGVTKDYSPRHPLYLPKTAKPMVWREACS